MRQIWPTAGSAALAALALVLVSVALFQSVGLQATGPNGMAIDVGDVTGNSSTTLGTINTCHEVASGASYTLDVVLQGVNDVAAAQLTLTYSGSVTARTVADSLLNNESPDVGGSAAIDGGGSDAVPDADGAHTIVISNDAAIGSGGASGSGILIRLTMAAPSVGVPTTFALGLSATTLNDAFAGEITHHPHGASLQVGDSTPDGSCATPVDTDGDGIPDSSDNCPTTANPGQENADSDAFGDVCDNCPAVNTLWVVPPGDIDCDAFTDVRESVIGTNVNDRCPETIAANDEPVDAWPPDLTDNRVVDIQDLNAMLPFLFTVNARSDLNVDGIVDIQDLNAVLPFLFRSCTP